MSVRQRIGWVAIASVLAMLALGVAFATVPDGERRVSLTAAAVYVPLVLLIAVATYLLHRRARGPAHGVAWPRALTDTALAALVGGPALWFVLLVAATIRDCTTGPGC